MRKQCPETGPSFSAVSADMFSGSWLWLKHYDRDSVPCRMIQAAWRPIFHGNGAEIASVEVKMIENVGPYQNGAIARDRESVSESAAV